ncbi:MAG TPA: hypothetical protein VIH28_01365 [Ignavibacteriaceae bacterium]
MKIILTLASVLFFFCMNNAQTKIDDDISPAFLNAKKGIYWALSNIPGKKTKIENDLIANDKLYTSVKLQKEIGGIKIESTGYGESISVTIIVYRSYDNLKKEGYIKKIEEPQIE